MTKGQFRNDQGQSIINQVDRTDSAWERLRGLLGRPALTADNALWIAPCNSVHCFFMGYTIDLVYLDQQQTIIKTVANLKPWGVSACIKAKSVVEMAAGSISKFGLATGATLVWQPCET